MNFPQVSFLLHLILAVNIIIGVESRKLHQRERRSAISLPEGSTVTVTMDLIVPVVPLLNTTLTYLWFDLPLTFDVPTASNLNELYSSLGLIDGSSSQGKDEDEDDDSRSYTSLRDNFVEEQRASHEQRQVYRYVEGFFQKYVLINFCKYEILKIKNITIERSFGLNGKMCMKRAICELAEAPLGNHGLFGTIFELLFL